MRLPGKIKKRDEQCSQGEPPTPGQSLGHRSLTIWGTVTVLAVTAVVMLLLGAEPLHRNADLMEPSPFRSAALVVTGGLLRASNVLHADWPWQQVALGEKSPVTTGV